MASRRRPRKWVYNLDQVILQLCLMELDSPDKDNSVVHIVLRVQTHP